MTLIAYEDWRPSRASRALVDAANSIIEEYTRQGYELTLRQLYYQFVARDLIENTHRSYKNLGAIIGRGRMAGLISWRALEDRTRNLTAWRTFDSAEEAIRDARASFTLEKWDRQPVYVEVWIEKEALAGVFERICSRLEVPFFPCRGYVSLSEMWSASQRLRRRIDQGRRVVVLHFGDHDPSGIDMTRDIIDRSALFSQRWGRLEVKRVALNMEQIERYDPPPNPAKLSDSRASDYVAEHGYESWELDALDPATLSELVTAEVELLRDAELWEAAEAEETEAAEALEQLEDRWAEVVEWLQEGDA